MDRYRPTPFHTDETDDMGNYTTFIDQMSERIWLRGFSVSLILKWDLLQLMLRIIIAYNRGHFEYKVKRSMQRWKWLLKSGRRCRSVDKLRERPMYIITERIILQLQKFFCICIFVGKNNYDIVTCQGLCEICGRVLDWMIGFIDTQLVTTNNYSVPLFPHFTVHCTHTLVSSVFISCFLVTDS
jgi:hypothetical protein